jgi:hypothetical protein
MKKFSSITGQKVNEEPKVEVTKQQEEMDMLKYGILKLMDNCLSIRSYGSARAELLNGSLAISGKEMFVEALLDLMDGKKSDEQIQTLESLKSESNDWKSIDKRIDEIIDYSKRPKLLQEHLPQVKKIKSFLETYSEDERFIDLLETYTLRVKDPSEANLRSLVASKMKNDGRYLNYSSKLSQISEKFLQRAKDLGFNDAN